jgi:hypothetical protein
MNVCAVRASPSSAAAHQSHKRQVTEAHGTRTETLINHSGRRMARVCLVPKIFHLKTSHRILRHMHKALNVDETKN